MASGCTYQPRRAFPSWRQSSRSLHLPFHCGLGRDSAWDDTNPIHDGGFLIPRTAVGIWLSKPRASTGPPRESYGLCSGLSGTTTGLSTKYKWNYTGASEKSGASCFVQKQRASKCQPSASLMPAPMSLGATSPRRYKSSANAHCMTFTTFDPHGWTTTIKAGMPVSA